LALRLENSWRRLNDPHSRSISMGKRWNWVLVGFLVTGGSAAFAAEMPGREFVVDGYHPQAADANEGTVAEPWKTIGGNISRLKPGDTVLVREGTYREQVILHPEGWSWAGGGIDVGPVASGEPGRRISFFAWPGEDVVIKGSDVVDGWAHFRDHVWVKSGWGHNSQQVFVDGKILQQISGEMVDYLVEADRWQGRMGVGLQDMAPGSFYYDSDEQNLYVWLEDGGDPNRHLVEASVRPFLFRVGISYTNLSGIRMMHSNTSAYINWAAVALDGSHNVMENVEVTWTDYIAVSLGGSFNTVVNCTFNHNGNSGMAGRGHGHRVIDSTTSFNNYRNWKGDWHAGGMKIIPHAHDWVVSGHSAAYNKNSPGIWFDGWMSNVTIRNSLAHDNGQSGIFFEIGERGVIKNNVTYRNGHRGIYVADSSDTLVAHNLALENGMSGIAVVGTGRRGGEFGRAEDEVLWVRNNIVWGNMLVDNAYPPLLPEGWGDRPELIMPDERETNYNNSSDYNISYRTDGRSVSIWEGWGAGRYTFDYWREKTGNDKNSVIAEPLFVDRERLDFRPAQGSPAIGLVRPQMSVAFDFDERRRDRKQYYTAGPFEVER